MPPEKTATNQHDLVKTQITHRNLGSNCTIKELTSSVLAHYVKRFAPWANDMTQPLFSQEICISSSCWSSLGEFFIPRIKVFRSDFFNSLLSHTQVTRSDSWATNCLPEHRRSCGCASVTVCVHSPHVNGVTGPGPDERRQTRWDSSFSLWLHLFTKGLKLLLF